MLERNFS